MRDIHAALMAGPFSREQAAALGVTKSMLQGSRFVRVHPGVWRCRDRAMTAADWRRAAALALPDRARTTHVTRLQQLGLDVGAVRPVHLVIEGDHHLAIPGIFLHRTVVMPPIDETGVLPCAAFVAFCADARTIEAIGVGDWLIQRGHMTVAELTALVVAQPWRRGAAEAAWVLGHLRPGARSIAEAHTRAMIEFAGLPSPEYNAPVQLTDQLTVRVDLWFEEWMTAVEYEGAQHQEDRGQYVSDIDRYAVYRSAGVGYCQITKELMRSPRAVVRSVHGLLVEGGYDGPPPTFGDRWSQLFTRLSLLVPREQRSARARAVS